MSEAMPAPVEVIGAGLVGTSVALACRRAGYEVLLSDSNAQHLRIATGLGAGRVRRDEDRPALVVVAVPPDHLADVITDALQVSQAIVTDVGSIKSAPLRDISHRVSAADLARYVGSHPMAGSERTGPLAASATLFDARPWAVTAPEGADPDAVAAVEALVTVCGGTIVRLSPEEHDQAVARTSHLPYLAAVLVAGRIAEGPAEHLALAGPGLRDVTRVAGSDPALWSQIVSANTGPVLSLLERTRDELDVLIAALTEGRPDQMGEVLTHGVAGTEAIPAKHGGRSRPMQEVFVSVPDAPGALARLFADVGTGGINIEDIRIDHDPGRPAGLLELVVDADRAEDLVAALESRGWATHG